MECYTREIANGQRPTGACSELSLESIEQAWFVVQPGFPIPQAWEMKELRSVGQGTTERLLNSLQMQLRMKKRQR